MNNRIGLMGGSFDPIHLAHLMLAEQAFCQLQLDEVWWIPANQSPLKSNAPIASNHDRVTMLKRAISDVEHYKLQDVEHERSGPSFTIDTVMMLIDEHPGKEFYFILGADQMQVLHHWHRIDELIRLVRFVRTARPGYANPVGMDVKSEWSNRFLDIEMPQLDISSTVIRNRVANGMSIRWWVPDPVREWIVERDLYVERTH